MLCYHANFVVLLAKPYAELKPMCNLIVNPVPYSPSTSFTSFTSFLSITSLLSSLPLLYSSDPNIFLTLLSSYITYRYISLPFYLPFRYMYNTHLFISNLLICSLCLMVDLLSGNYKGSSTQLFISLSVYS